MSNVQTGAEREAISLDHFMCTTGHIGRLKVISTQNVLAGDSYEDTIVGSFRLSPLRRGLVVDSKLELFTFFIPYRHIYGSEWIDFLKNGVPKSGPEATLSRDPFDPATTKPGSMSFLGLHTPNDVNSIPKWYYQSYLQIYNNYFKTPYQPDKTDTLQQTIVNDSGHNSFDGFPCAHLEAPWATPLNNNAEKSHNVGVDAVNGLDIMNLNAAYGVLQTQQERDHFMQRYRDVVSSFGGSTYYDADNRPKLIQHSEHWTSGYDVDGTTQESLGQYAGRMAQSFVHHVPRWYVPEHGVIMTLQLCRFPPIHQYEQNMLVNMSGTYSQIAGDPAIVGNHPPVDLPLTTFLTNADKTKTMKVPYGQWYRCASNWVDSRYIELDGFPFAQYTFVPYSDQHLLVKYDAYDHIFQSAQLGQYQIQAKSNCTVYRRFPTARDSIMTN